MNSFFFWNDWRFSYKSLYLFGLLTLLAAMGLFVFYFSVGNDLIIDWQKEGNLEVIKTTTDQFTKNFFTFAAQTDVYLLTEKFVATNMIVNQLPYYAHLYFSLIGFLFFLTALSDLKRIGYFVGIGIMLLFFSSMQLEILGIFDGITNKAFLILIILCYGPLSYYFHYFNKNVAFIYRFICYVIITSILVFVGKTYAEVDFPAMYATNFGVFLPVVIAILFVGLNAHENIRGMLTLVTLNKDRHSFRHLSVLVIIYFLNLIYCYFKFTAGMDWGIFYIHPFYLFLASMLIGIWGFKARENQYRGLMSFTPTGAFLYLGLAIMTVSTIGFALGTANDPLIEVFEDVTLYGLFCWGVVMYAYIIANFIDFLAEGAPVYKVFFKPKRIDFATSSFFGAVFFLILFLKSGMLPYRQAFAGYYNGLADIEYVEEDFYESKQYYNIALGYDTRNHRSHYSLGSIARKEGNQVAASIFFSDATQKKPSPYAFANLASFQQRNNRTLEALLTLQKGVEVLPKNGELQNNLGLLFNQTAMSDSVFYYFDLAQKYSKQPEIPASNLYALLTKYDFLSYIDSVYQWENQQPYVGKAGNQLAFYNKIGNTEPRELNRKFLADTVLNTPQLCYLYNYTISQLNFAGDSLLNTLSFYASRPENETFATYLQYARALILFKKNEVKEAVRLMREVVRYAGFTNQDYPNQLGLWLYELEQYEEAARYFRMAWQRGYADAGVNLGLAFSELADKQRAIEHWQLLTRLGNDTQKQVASDMLKFFIADSLPTNWYLQTEYTDTFRFRFLHYARQQIEKDTFEEILKSMQAEEYKVAALAERILFLIKEQEFGASLKLYVEQLQKIEVIESLKPLYQRALLAYLHATNQYNNPFFSLVNEVSFSRVLAGLKTYYQAVAYQQENKLDESLASYQMAQEQLPFYAKVYQSQAELLTAMDSLDQSYNVLLQGIQFNEDSESLLKSYALKCADLGYDSYAESTLVQLKTMVEEQEFEQFAAKLELRQTKVEEKLNW